MIPQILINKTLHCKAELIFVTNITNYIRGEKICHVEIFQLSMTMYANCGEIENSFTCGEKLSPKIHLWRKNDNYEAWLHVFESLGQSQPTAGKAQTGSSGQNSVMGCSQRLGSRLWLSSRLNWWWGQNVTNRQTDRCTNNVMWFTWGPNWPSLVQNRHFIHHHWPLRCLD